MTVYEGRYFIELCHSHLIDFSVDPHKEASPMTVYERCCYMNRFTETQVAVVDRSTIVVTVNL